MQFLVLGYDGSDDKAVERRMAVREDHLTGSLRMYATGRWRIRAHSLTMQAR